MKLFLFAFAVVSALALYYLNSDYQDDLRRCMAQDYSEDTCISLLR